MKIIPANAPLTMTSVEIAELCDKRHDHVMRDIKNMLDALELAAPSFGGSYLGGNGKALPCYHLPRDLTMTLVTGYSIPLRKKVIDRWIELEGQSNASNVTFLVPKSLPEALRLAADLADKVEEQKAVIDVLEPKANFHDAVTSAVNCQTVQEAAKLIGTGQNRLFKKLREAKLLMNDNQPYQSAIEAGYFRMVEGQYKDKRGESHTYTRTLVTGKGLAYIQKHFGSAA